MQGQIRELGVALKYEVVSDHLADICIEERLVGILAELSQFVEEFFSKLFGSYDMIRVRFALKHEALEDSK